ncbi:hypothetical protein ABBQ32_013149 [Trebouxia sp. C0010 RCD-2024]
MSMLPLQLLVGEGKNAKYVKACTELFMGGQGLDHLEGFDKLVNLEVLWVNDNQLESVHGLDSNFRMRVLHAENNSICSLKGSLSHFKFLETLDLSNNQLRNLPKLAANLAKFQYLTFLNLKVLPEERKSAAAVIGGKTAELSVAFGKRAPQYDPAWSVKTSERSGLEQDLGQAVTLVKAKRAAQAGQGEAQLYARDPYGMRTVAPGQPLPAPPGWTHQSAIGAATSNGKAAQSGSSALRPCTYRPLDIFSFSTCAMAPADIPSEHDSLPDATRGTFKDTLLMTASTKGAAVQLLQKSVRL